ncbi:MAG: 2,3-bisphosphoglycerate-independent phosphoglycerate mutase [Pseudomonadales bacterium]|jgi:2,3-bisphosphoglycerate-independent phosphoglycerate mutase|nr:2,3-bisphosphoglycerate-independent phosphoglycerate mutase [Pseudomonadales bacterium]
MEPTNKHIIQPQISGMGFTQESPRKSYGGPKPVVLLILDGWGIGPNYAGNAITLANTPNMDMFWLSFPHTQLAASGEAVGLPRGEDGNSETGHVNIGAGNIVYQDLPRINMSVADGSFEKNEAFLAAINHAKKNNSRLHLMGLIGEGGVHSNLSHLFALLQLCAKEKFNDVYIHGFTDGRDSPPFASLSVIKEIEEKCQELQTGRIASVMGRFFSLDRDKRWDRIEKAYNCMVLAEGLRANSALEAVEAQHVAGNTDEFVEPTNILDRNGNVVTIGDNDATIFFNFRIDRPRELTHAFVISDFEQGYEEGHNPYAEQSDGSNLKQTGISPTFQRKKVLDNLLFITMTRYEDGLPVMEAFPPQPVREPLCKVLADAGLKQLRCAETEKESFVTYYMNGQKDIIFPGEDRVILPSKGEKSYDQVPEMSAREIAQEIVYRVKNSDYDAMIVNIANCDMVGHTGNLEAGIKACEVVDEVVGMIVRAVYQKGGVAIITADHGNVEEMINSESGEVDTEHSTYPVPFIVIGQQYFNQHRTLMSGVLADIAPTMLSIMGFERPPSMTGRSLI